MTTSTDSFFFFGLKTLILRFLCTIAGNDDSLAKPMPGSGNENNLERKERHVCDRTHVCSRFNVRHRPKDRRAQSPEIFHVSDNVRTIEKAVFAPRRLPCRRSLDRAISPV